MSQPTELAPSDVRAEAPTVARIAGMAGLFLATVGVVSVVASWYGKGLFGEGFGYLAALVGFAGLFVHASRDGDLEVRRLYGLLAAVLLVVAAVAGIAHASWSGGADAGPEARVKALVPFVWPAAALLALLFAVTFARHETDEQYRRIVRLGLLGLGGLLALSAVGVGVFKPDFLAGPGVLLALLGLGYAAAFMALEGTTEGLGYWTAIGLGVLGGVALLVAIAATVGPTVLYEGPDALKKASHAYDRWAVIGRVIAVLAGLGVAALALNRSSPLWLRGVAPVVGLAFAGLLITGSFTKAWAQPPTPYLVPYGLLLGGIGLIYLAAAAAVVSDSPIVVIARRELAAYFYSPIAYLVLFGMAFAAAWAYLDFLFRLGVVGSLMEADPSQEPIVQMYMAFGILGAFTAVFLVPAVTMRLFSEETRTGTLEVLMTAPVTEASVVLGKFVAAWVFFMVCWIPAGLYLIALWSAGGAFDYRPLLSFYLALGCCAASFIGMGMFFSTLTRNQIIAAVLTFSWMMFLLLTVLAQEFAVLPPGLRSALAKLDFLNMWMQSLSGQLPVHSVIIQLSMGAFWLFMTTKVLEARKWS